VDTIRIGIPTLNQYTLLGELLSTITRNLIDNMGYEITIIDNGGTLQDNEVIKSIKSTANRQLRYNVISPTYNLGVAASFNYFIQNLGQCLICNDDVTITYLDIKTFLEAAEKKPKTVLFENSDPISGFSTFYVNRPEIINMIGGFDELFSPAYFEDNDIRYRLKTENHVIEKIKLPTWTHKTSSTLKQSDRFYKRLHWCNYYRNRNYYILKWGGLPGKELYLNPFGIIKE
jgi:GT2 family glycosyltransferase